MEYSSLLFIYAFFPLSLVVYYLSPKKYRDLALLMLSMVFSGLFGAGSLVLLLVYTAVNYVCGRSAGALREKKNRCALSFNNLPSSDRYRYCSSSGYT